MRTYATALVVTVLFLGSVGAGAAQTAAGPTEVSETEPEASPTAPDIGSLQFAHAAEGAPAWGVDLFSPTAGRVGMWVAQPGDITAPNTIDLVPDTPLVPGIYRMSIMPAEGGATAGGPEIASFDVPIGAGFTTVVTGYVDQVGRPLFILHTPTGQQTVKPLFEGTLVVDHDVEAGPSVEVVIWVLEHDDETIALGTLAPGGMLEDRIEAGPHTLLLYAGGEEVGRTDTFVVHEETTVLRVSDLLEGGTSAQAASSSPRSTPSEGPTSEFPVPSRVETGSGGSIGRTPMLLVAPVLVVLLAAAAVAYRRHRGSEPTA